MQRGDWNDEMSDSAYCSSLAIRLITLAPQYHAARSRKNKYLQSRWNPDGRHHCRRTIYRLWFLKAQTPLLFDLLRIVVQQIIIHNKSKPVEFSYPNITTFGSLLSQIRVSVCLSSVVCLLSVTFVHPTQGLNFRQYFFAILPGFVPN